ncbi:MAG: FGGY family carbohydrate kinase [Polyangiaceae bacterium]
MTDVVLGVDASTTGVKVIAWDAQGTALAEARETYELESPTPGAWEQDAEQWWRCTCDALRRCRDRLDGAHRVRGLCVTHQRETFVLTDAAGIPQANAIVWMDGRGRELVDEARGPLSADDIHELSGKPACITPSYYKLFALFARRPELHRPELRVMDVQGFLGWRLTGNFRTSLASADPLGLVDMRARSWATPLLHRLGLTSAQLPELVECGSELGALLPEVAERTGLEPGLPIVAGLGDGQAAGLGAGLTTGDDAYLNLGTAIVSGVLSERYQTSRAFRTLYSASSDRYFCETDLLGGTFTLNWLTRTLLQNEDSSSALRELEAAAARLPPGADGLLLVPYWAGVMNPYWDDDARGVMLGLSGSHGPAHLHRAILEGIALEHGLHSEGVEAALGRRIRSFVVMGGGADSDLWCQILADVLARPVVRARSKEATCLGAGMLAAVHAGLQPDLVGAASTMTGRGVRFEPGPARDTYAHLQAIHRRIYPSLRESLHALAAFRDSGP